MMNKDKILASIVNEAFNKFLKEYDDMMQKEQTDEYILLNADPNDIIFEKGDNLGLIHVNIYVNDKLINIKGLRLSVEPKPRIESGAFQLHISVPTALRQKGVATKLYTVFLQKYGNIVSLYSNRISTYAKENGMSVSHDSAIDKMLLSAAKNASADVERLYFGDTEAGLILFREDKREWM